jgi:hypothetical protein
VEYNWGHAQTGFAVLFTVRSGATDSGAWAVVEDITFTNNIVRHAAGGFNGHGFDPIPPTPGPRAQRWLICNNLFDDIDGDRWNGDGRVFQLISGPSHVVIEHNTGIGVDKSALVLDGCAYWAPAGGAVPSSALGLTSMGTGPNSGWARAEGVHVAYAPAMGGIRRTDGL